MSHSTIPRTIAHLVTRGLSLVPGAHGCCAQLLTSARTRCIKVSRCETHVRRCVGYPLGIPVMESYMSIVMLPPLWSAYTHWSTNEDVLSFVVISSKFYEFRVFASYERTYEPFTFCYLYLQNVVWCPTSVALYFSSIFGISFNTILRYKFNKIL